MKKLKIVEKCDKNKKKRKNVHHMYMKLTKTESRKNFKETVSK